MCHLALHLLCHLRSRQRHLAEQLSESKQRALSGVWHERVLGTRFSSLHKLLDVHHSVSGLTRIIRESLSVFVKFVVWLKFQAMIPLPLYVTIEFVKLGQVFFITNDLGLYDEERDKPMECKALNITEDLGQIQYVFSDKTGTLTENKMEFKRCCVNGKDFECDRLAGDFHGQFLCIKYTSHKLVVTKSFSINETLDGRNKTPNLTFGNTSVNVATRNVFW